MLNRQQRRSGERDSLTVLDRLFVGFVAVVRRLVLPDYAAGTFVSGCAFKSHSYSV